MAAAEGTAVTLQVPKLEDFQELAALQTAAFSEKLTCISARENQKEMYEVYCTYLQQYPARLQHCRMLKSSDGTIVAACQLQAEGDPGDLSFPEELRHDLEPNEVYVEWIACHPDHLGNGHGSALLRWADDFSRGELSAKRLSLAVMAGNKGAVRLYERKGYVIQPDTHTSVCGSFCRSCFIFCFMGGRYWTLLYMEKDLDLSPPQAPQPGGGAGPKEPIQVASAPS